MNFRLSVLASCALLACSVPLSSAHSADLSLMPVLNSIADESIDTNQKALDKLRTDLQKAMTHSDEIQTNLAARDIKAQKESNLDPDAYGALMGLPKALADTDLLTKTFLGNRYIEVNRIKPPQEKEEYLIDTTLKTGDIPTQQRDIDARFFCDPLGRNGTNKDLQFDLVNVPRGGSTINYTVGCGKVLKGNALSREKITGDDSTLASQQLIGLPTQPAKLFFYPTTFPVTPAKGDTTTPNTNPGAYLYQSAFALSLQYLLGSAPDSSEGIETNKAVTRLMLASYPFAVMFSERVGTMGPDAAASLARLSQKGFATNSKDPILYATIQNIKKRKNVSLAEYMDIVMYQVPMSPGYNDYINRQKNIYRLRRESVWLSAMQTALNYQRNRWLEILAALEATR